MGVFANLSTGCEPWSFNAFRRKFQETGPHQTVV
jgi:hypothetical protein